MKRCDECIAEKRLSSSSRGIFTAQIVVGISAAIPTAFTTVFAATFGVGVAVGTVFAEFTNATYQSLEPLRTSVRFSDRYGTGLERRRRVIGFTDYFTFLVLPLRRCG